MAKTGNFTYTNTTASLVKALPLFDTKEKENYGPVSSNGKTTYLNKACDTDAREKFAMFASSVKNVPSSCEVTYPSPKRLAAQDSNQKVQEGILFGIYTDAIHRTTDSNDASYIVDRPVRVELRITMEDTSTITDAELKELMGRTVSHFFAEDGSPRFSMLRGKVTEIAAD